MSCFEIFRCIVCLAEFLTADELREHRCPKQPEPERT